MSPFENPEATGQHNDRRSVLKPVKLPQAMRSRPSREVCLRSFLDAVEQHVSDPSMRAWAGAYAPPQMHRVWSDVDLVLSLRPTSVLNVGGAPFLFEYVFRQRAPDVRLVSVDLAPERLGGLTKTLSVEVLRGDIERETVTNERFDIVVFNEVLEHCRQDLIGTVNRIASLMNDEGYLIIATPNGRSLQNINGNLFGRTGPSLVTEWRKLHEIGHMGHVREYSRCELEELFAYCGLRVRQMKYRRQIVDRSLKLSTQIARLMEAVLPPLRHNLAFVLQKDKDRHPQAD